MIPKMVQLYKNKALSGDSGTETFPLKRNDLVIGYMVKIRAANGATNNDFDAAAEATVERSITKIEVKSGSAVFKSYDGEMCRKIATYRNGILPETLITGVAGGTWAGNSDPLLGWQEAVFPIDFCIKQDPYGNRTGTIFPAPLYDSLDLVIDYNFTISATAGFATGGANHVMDVYALTLPKQEKGAMENKHILVESKKIDYTTVASGDESFDLTLDNNRFLRHLYVNCYEQGIGEGVDITDLVLKVEGNNEWASKWGDLQAQNALDCNLKFEKKYYGDPTDGSTAHYTRVPAARGMVTGYEAPTVVPWLGYNNDTVTVTNDSGELYELLIRSDVLPGMAVMDFDKDGLMQNMQYCGVKDLDLQISNGGAGGATQILEQHWSKAWGY